MRGDYLKNRRKKKKAITQNLIPVLIFLLGVAIMAYPTFSDWWNSMHQSRAISSYITIVDETEEEEIRAMWNAAEQYNRDILKKSNIYTMTDSDIRRYESLLDISGSGIMGYVEIGSIGVNLPIYHGTNEAVLQTAIGHIDWTSLPVGGPSTHTVISGHRGLPRAKLFSDIDRLQVGDTFTITVLKQTMTYMVDRITIVEPEDTSDLQVVEGMDLCTLVTCTPYGINTHRLLVRGHRIENFETEYTVTSGASRVSNILVVAAVFIPLLFLLLLGLLVADYTEIGPIPV